MIELPSPCLVVLVGPPGAGKSTWAATHLPDMAVSSDAMRAMVGEGVHDLRATADAFELVDHIVERRLHRGLTTVVDSLGTEAGRRDKWRSIAARHGVPCIAIVFDLPAAQVRRQNRQRAARVPDSAIDALLAQWPRTLAAVELEPFAAVHRAEPAMVVPPVLMRSNSSESSLARTDASVASSVASLPATGTLRFGLQVPVVTWPEGPTVTGDRLRAIAAAAESSGFDGLWMMDHMRQIPMHGPPWADILESWTALAHLAACTQRIRLGTLVTALTFRNVAHLAKIVATLDVLSGGRVDCGVGLGWFQDEHVAYGLPFPSLDHRYAILEDALQLLPRMWGAGSKPFEGKVLRVPDTSCYPRPLQSHVPIMVGGSGERRTLRLVARYADACNLFGDPATVAHKVKVLHQHCGDVGRDPAEVSVSHLSTVLIGDDAAHVRALLNARRPSRMSAERYARSVNAGTVEQHIQRVGRYVEAGVDHIILSLVDLPASDAAAIHRAGQVISASR